MGLGLEGKAQNRSWQAGQGNAPEADRHFTEDSGGTRGDAMLEHGWNLLPVVALLQVLAQKHSAVSM